MTDQQHARDLLERAERAATAGDLASADELLRDAARIQEQELGPHHPDLANTLNNLAIVAERTGRSSEAETFYRRAVAIAAAALPSDHPMTVASRQNLEDFCRARGLPIDAPAIATPTEAPGVETPAEDAKREAIAQPPSAAPRPNPVKRETIAPDPLTGKASHLLPWMAAGAVVLIAAVLLLMRPWSSRNASPAAQPAPAASQPAEVVPPQVAPPPASAAPSEPPAATASPPTSDDRNVPAKRRPAAGSIAVAAQLCRTLSTSGGNWRCDPVGDTAAAGPMVFYTRVRSSRDITVVHRWYHGGTLRQSVTLSIRANATEGYRTYSRLTVDKGDWRLEVRSADGNLLHEQRFAVQ